MGTGKFNAEGNPVMDQHPIQGRVELLPVASYYRNQSKLRPDELLGLNADLTYEEAVRGCNSMTDDNNKCYVCSVML